MYVDTKLPDVGFELVRFMKLQDILWKQMDPAVTMLETATTLPSVNYQTKNSNIHRIGKKRNDPLSRIFLHELDIFHSLSFPYRVLRENCTSKKCELYK